MALTATATYKADDGMVTGTIVFSGNYPGSGGDVLNFSSLGIPGKRKPFYVGITGQAGFVYQYKMGTTAADGQVTVFCNTAGGANNALGEHTTAAYAAGVSGDTVEYIAIFGPLGSLQ